MRIGTAPPQPCQTYMRMSIYRYAMPTSLLLLAAMLIPVDAMAMRCGSKLISKGDPEAKVIRYCGEPTTASRRYAERVGFYRDARFYYSRNYRSEIVIEDWVYNLGPNKLMRRITLENGIVKDVKTLGRGYRD